MSERGHFRGGPSNRGGRGGGHYRGGGSGGEGGGGFTRGGGNSTGRGRGGGGLSSGRGGGHQHGASGGGGGGSGSTATGNAGGEKAKKENILDLAKYLDKEIRVKFGGGREGYFHFPLSPSPPLYFPLFPIWMDIGNRSRTI